MVQCGKLDESLLCRWQVLMMSYNAFLAGGDFKPLAQQQEGDSSLAPGDKVWDVCVIKERLFASIHTGKSDDRSRLHEYTLEGRFVRSICSPNFQEPNMMAVQH